MKRRQRDANYTRAGVEEAIKMVISVPRLIALIL